MAAESGAKKAVKVIETQRTDNGWHISDLVAVDGFDEYMNTWSGSWVTNTAGTWSASASLNQYQNIDLSRSSVTMYAPYIEHAKGHDEKDDEDE